jgi:uncharacterized membrane protein YphA (DoxX/SURF4 family)
MRLLVNICRFIVGLAFIFSGLIKANDPLGLSYKMQEFFEVWNFHLLDNFTLVFSTIMIVFEILAGLALILGWRMKLFSWLLLLLIIFFSFLTGYAYISGKVKECGCFGNCIPLTAGESFFKDLLLLAGIVFLFASKEKVKPLLKEASGLLVLALTAVFVFSFQWYVMQYLPIVDCLPYSIGSDIPAKMKIAPGAIPDSTVISFVYKKDGRPVEFTADHFPANFDDSYKFVKRYDKLIRKGNAEPAIKDFILLTGSGTDSTSAILTQKGYKLFIFSKTISTQPQEWEKDFSVIFSFAKSKKIPLYFITSDFESVESWVNKNEISKEVTVLKCDATAVKTADRADPTLYLMKGGRILNKWGNGDFENAIKEISGLPEAGNASGL